MAEQELSQELTIKPDAEALQAMIHEYQDVIRSYPELIQATRRLSEFRELIITQINENLDRSTHAIYVEPPTPGAPVHMYKRSDDGERWEYWYDFREQGQRLPVIGDTIVQQEDALIVVDTARGIGIGNIDKLEIRPKDNDSVQEFSDEQATERLQKMGQVATEHDVTPILTRDRWGQTSVTPPIS